MSDIVGPQEIALMLGVQVNTVHAWTKRGLMPAPERVISKVPLWTSDVISAWAASTGRLVTTSEG